MEEIRQDRNFALQSMSVSLSGDSMSDRFRIMQSMSQAAHNNDAYELERGTGNVTMNTTTSSAGAHGAQEAPYGLSNDLRYRGIAHTPLGSSNNNDTREEMSRSLNGIRNNNRGMACFDDNDNMHHQGMSNPLSDIRNRGMADSMNINDETRGMAQSRSFDGLVREGMGSFDSTNDMLSRSLNGIRNTRGVTRVNSGSNQEMSRSLNGIRNTRGVSRVNSASKQEMSQSLNGIRSRRNRDVTRVHSDSLREMPHSPYGIRNRREVTRAHSDSIRNIRRGPSRKNSDSMSRIPKSLYGIRNRRGVTRTSSDNMEEMAHSLYGTRNRRELTRTNSDTMEDMAQSLYGARNRRELTRTKSDNIQSMSQSLNGIRNRGITRMSQALDLTQERQPIQLQEELVRASSYISRRGSSGSNNAMPISLNGFVPSTNQEGVGEFTNQQRNRARVEDDGLSRSFNDVRDTCIDRSSQYRGMTLMDDDNYGNKNALESNANAAIQQDQELIKLSSSSFGNSNLCTNDSAPNMENLLEKYGVAAATKDSKTFVQQHNHIRTTTTASTTTDTDTETEIKQQQQQDSHSDSKMINESMKVLMESMKRSAASRKLVKQFSSPFTIASDDKTPYKTTSSSLSNSKSLVLSSNSKQQHVVVKAKRNSIGRCKHDKPQLQEESRSSYRKMHPFSFDTTTTARCDSPTPYTATTAFTTSAAVHPPATSPSNNNNNFFSNQPHQDPYFPSHNDDDCDENSVLMESSLFPTIQAPEDNYSIATGARHLSHRNNVDDNIDDGDNDDYDNDNDNVTVVSQLSFMNLPVTNNDHGNDVNIDDDIVSVSSATTSTSWLWRIAEAAITAD